MEIIKHSEHKVLMRSPLSYFDKSGTSCPGSKLIRSNKMMAVKGHRGEYCAVLLMIVQAIPFSEVKLPLLKLQCLKLWNAYIDFFNPVEALRRKYYSHFEKQEGCRKLTKNLAT